MSPGQITPATRAGASWTVRRSSSYLCAPLPDHRVCMSLGSGLYDGTVVREDYSDYVLKSGFRDRELDRTALNAINATNLITPGRSNKELLFLAHPLLGDDYGKSIRGRNWLG